MRPASRSLQLASSALAALVFAHIYVSGLNLPCLAFDPCEPESDMVSFLSRKPRGHHTLLVAITCSCCMPPAYQAPQFWGRLFSSPLCVQRSREVEGENRAPQTVLGRAATQAR